MSFTQGKTLIAFLLLIGVFPLEAEAANSSSEKKKGTDNETKVKNEIADAVTKARAEAADALTKAKAETAEALDKVAVADARARAAELAEAKAKAEIAETVAKAAAAIAVAKNEAAAAIAKASGGEGGDPKNLVNHNEEKYGKQMPEVVSSINSETSGYEIIMNAILIAAVGGIFIYLRSYVSNQLERSVQGTDKVLRLFKDYDKRFIEICAVLADLQTISRRTHEELATIPSTSSLLTSQAQSMSNQQSSIIRSPSGPNERNSPQTYQYPSIEGGRYDKAVTARDKETGSAISTSRKDMGQSSLNTEKLIDVTIPVASMIGEMMVEGLQPTGIPFGEALQNLVDLLQRNGVGSKLGFLYWDRSAHDDGIVFTQQISDSHKESAECCSISVSKGGIKYLDLILFPMMGVGARQADLPFCEILSSDRIYLERSKLKSFIPPIGRLENGGFTVLRKGRVEYQ